MNDVIKDLSELRLSYQKGELHEAHVDKNPHVQFLTWFNASLEAKLHEPYAMSLATANAQGRPHVRTVLLRGATEAGYDFYSNYDSQKGLDLISNPYAELLFYWPELERQIRVSGKVEKISLVESTDYYHNVHVIAKLQRTLVRRKVVSLPVVKNCKRVSKPCKIG